MTPKSLVMTCLVSATLAMGGAGAVLAAEAYKSPMEGGPRLLEVTGVSTTLNMRAEASATAAVVARLAKGARLTNLGCSMVAEKVWCDVQPFDGGARGFVSGDYLKPAVGPDGAVAMGEDDSALRLGQGKFDAEGQVPCAAKEAQPMGMCAFKVARGTGGYATIDIAHPDSLTRTIFFADGKAIGFSSAQSDGSASLSISSSKTDDLNRISIGTERYEIPDAAILGG